MCFRFIGFLILFLNLAVVQAAPLNSPIQCSRLLLESPSVTVKKGIWQKFKLLFKSSPDPLTAVSESRFSTEVRLSGWQEIQKTSIHDDLQLVSEMIEQINHVLLKELQGPDVVFVNFRENAELGDASISYFEMNITSNEHYDEAFRIPVIVHEYFHLILNRELAKKDPFYQKAFESKLLGSYKQRETHRVGALKRKLFITRGQIEQTDWILGQIKIMEDWGDSAFTPERIQKFLREPINELKQDHLFGNLEINRSRVPELIATFSQFKEMQLLRASHLESLIAKYSQTLPPPVNDSDELSVESDILSFYSSSIHELFADLGAVLLARDPKVIANLLDAPLRDFSRLPSVDEGYMEFLRARKYDPHTFFSHVRGDLWLNYFSRVSSEKWPQMLKSLVDVFVKEMIQNPTAVPMAPIVDYPAASMHLEKEISKALGPFVSAKPDALGE